MTGLRWAVAGVAVALGLAGCAASAPSPAPTAAATVPASASDLNARRKAAGIADCPRSSDAPAVAGGLPELTLECLGGGGGVRLAGLRGPMLINLWAQWCEPCRSEAAHLSAFASTQQRVSVLGINYQDPQPELAIEFAALVSATYPQLVDEETVSKGPLAVPGIPLTILIDADGKVVARHPGQFVSLENVTEWVAQGLAK